MSTLAGGLVRIQKSNMHVFVLDFSRFAGIMLRALMLMEFTSLVVKQLKIIKRSRSHLFKLVDFNMRN